MIALDSLRWILTFAFAGVASFHLLSPSRHLLSDLLHAVMAVAMVVMVWPWGAVVPQALWLVVFAAATTWFVLRAARGPAGRGAAVFSATAMAAMVWMAAVSPGEMMPGMVMSPRHGWVVVVVGCYFVAASLGWVIRGMRLGALGAVPEPPHWPSVCHGVMSAGMGVAVLALL